MLTHKMTILFSHSCPIHTQRSRCQVVPYTHKRSRCQNFYRTYYQQKQEGKSTRQGRNLYKLLQGAEGETVANAMHTLFYKDSTRGRNTRRLGKISNSLKVQKKER